MIPLAAGKQSKLMAISTAPSFNYTNRKRSRVRGFTLVQTLDNATGTAEKTTFNGQPAYLLDKSTQPRCTGDEAGWAGGVKSGTVGGKVKPTSGSSSISIEGKSLIRYMDTCTMNNGNVIGKYVAVPSTGTEKAKSSEEVNYNCLEGNGADKYNYDDIKIDKVQELKNIVSRSKITAAEERFVGEKQAMIYLSTYENNAGEAWLQIRIHRNTYKGLREEDRNAEHYLDSLSQMRADPTVSHALQRDIATYGYSTVKLAANTLGSAYQLIANQRNRYYKTPFDEENPSPFRDTPPSISEVISGVTGRHDGVHGIQK